MTCLVLALVGLTGCTSEIPSSQTTAPSKPSSSIDSLPVKDCTQFQENVYGLQQSALDSGAKVIKEDFIYQWTAVVFNNSKCFTQDEYCDAIDAHNSVAPWGRQESSPYC